MTNSERGPASNIKNIPIEQQCRSKGGDLYPPTTEHLPQSAWSESAAQKHQLTNLRGGGQIVGGAALHEEYICRGKSISQSPDDFPLHAHALLSAMELRHMRALGSANKDAAGPQT